MSESAGARWLYLCVTLIELCPNQRETLYKLTPFRTNPEAKLCRKVCGVAQVTSAALTTDLKARRGSYLTLQVPRTVLVGMMRKPSSIR